MSVTGSTGSRKFDYGTKTIQHSKSTPIVVPNGYNGNFQIQQPPTPILWEEEPKKHWWQFWKK